MVQVCTCPQSNLTSGDPRCPVHGKQPESVMVSWCESCGILRAQLAEKDAQLCRMKEAFVKHAYAPEERKLGHFLELTAALKHVAPCCHEEEAKKLKDWMSRYKIPRRYGDRPDTSVLQLWEETELRRRAGEEEGVKVRRR